MTSSASFSQVFQERGGILVLEAERTSSDLGLWKKQNELPKATGEGYLQFLGNTFEKGPAKSPLEYVFRIHRSGLYYLHLHCAKEMHEERKDVANDCYVRVEGDFDAGPGPHGNHGDNASLALLRGDTKYYGGAVDKWKWESGAANGGNLDPGGHRNKRVAVYAFEAGETYKLVISGRSKFFRINRIMFRHTDVAADLAQSLSQPESLFENELSHVPRSFVYQALGDFPTIDQGEVPYYTDKKHKVLAIAANDVQNRKGFARASRKFEGKTNTYDVTITTLTEEDGESIYRLLVDGVQVATYTNPFVFSAGGTTRDLKPHRHTWSGIRIPNGATISVESKVDSNDQVSEAGDGKAPWAWARGRWQQIALTENGSKIRPPAGRLAIVADGNSPDPDDIGAMAVIFGLLSQSGLTDRLVHLSHSCDLDPFLNPGRQKIDKENELRRQKKLHELFGEGVDFWGPFPELADYYNCRTERAEAIADLTKAMNASSAKNPLWIIEAGEPDIIGYALRAAEASKRPFVHVVSHHPANDNSGDVFTWQQIKDFGVTEHQIGDQNSGLQVLIESGQWNWARNHEEPRIAWIWEQLKYAEQDEVVGFQKNKFDCSDAGMVYWWITGASEGGNAKSTPREIRELLQMKKQSQ
ncbi:MAG: hypothetical protein AB8D78_08090 [Akkermansiaceae bacterium]